jgi:hypothetical protein
MLLTHVSSYASILLLFVKFKISNCRMHMDTLRQTCTMGGMTESQLETIHKDQFCK